MPAAHSGLLKDFTLANADELLGTLTSGLAREGFDTTVQTTFSWQHQIIELQLAFTRLIKILPRAGDWNVLLEYVLPIVGQRVDCVVLADDLIYVIEYKSGNSTSSRRALQQAQDYALNLADFHECSRGRITIPIATGAFKTRIPLAPDSYRRGAAILPEELSDALFKSHNLWSKSGPPIDPREWNLSRYFPVPTIIEAASAIYGNHNVKDIASSRAGNDNLTATQAAISLAVAEARRLGTRKLLVVTGVPGAGKTLAGLNAVQLLSQKLDLNFEQASFLSGNGPLVAVLQEALKRCLGPRSRTLARSVRTRIREVHRFVRDSYGDTRAPADRLLVFDEAQRAWTAAKNKKKFDRDASEPEMILEIMGRHKGWAVIVALVGGGQEINGGEAGLAAWGDAISKHPEWEVLTSPEAVHGGPSVAGSRLFRAGLELARVRCEPELHLAISKRSFESDITAAWVNALLDGHPSQAKKLSEHGLPIYVTRDLEAARSWLRAHAKGTRRAGLVASSGAARLRACGVEPPTFDFSRGIDHVKWFLEPEGDFRSSNQLEVALSEFEMQGLEIDLAGLLWGGDLIFSEGRPVARNLKGVEWRSVSGSGDPQASADDPKTRILNKYRVLLTRFRKGMVIFVPPGSPIDQTQHFEDFDSVYDYLLACGVHLLSSQ